MTIRPLLFAAVFLVLASPVAFAHTGGHESDEEKLIPVTCVDLADTKRYSNDVAYPEIKALKLRCDKSAAKEEAAAKADATAKARAAAKAKASAEAKDTVTPAESTHTHSHDH